jgi:hypothetical protein
MMLRIQVFWVVTLNGRVIDSRCFKRTYRFPLQGVLEEIFFFEDEPASAWGENIKMPLEEIVLDGVDCIRLAKALVNEVINLLVS